MIYSVATPPHPRLAVVDLVGSGHLFGLIPALDGEPYIAQLEAVTEVRVAFASRQALLVEMASHSEVSKNMMLQMASTLRETEAWLINTL